MLSSSELMKNARDKGLVIPSFNVPYLPMIQPVVQAIVDQDACAFVATARLEWFKFYSQGLKPVMDEFQRWNVPSHVRMHLDHVPVVDEDGLRVDYVPLFEEALALGYHSVMVDGSRLSLEENIVATRRVADLAHKVGIPCEAELGAVMGHEAGPLPPYEELLASGKGFTSVMEAERFVRETGCDWLSVAIGNIHGAISGALRDQPKLEARLSLERLEALYQATHIPLVLHGGSGVKRADVLAAISKGIAKINVGTDLRQAYEAGVRSGGSVSAGQQAVYDRTSSLLREYFNLTGSRRLIAPGR